MRIRKPLIVAATLALAGTLSLSACGDSPKEAAPSATATEKAEGGKGFQEYPVGDDQIGYGNGNVGEINVSLVYFQPVDMEPAGMGLKASEASFHLEADISGLEGNDLGYGAGDFVPGLTVDYTITNKATNTVAAEGTFMQMNASDGPHYGGNIALPDAGGVHPGPEDPLPGGERLDAPLRRGDRCQGPVLDHAHRAELGLELHPPAVVGPLA